MLYDNEIYVIGTFSIPCLFIFLNDVYLDYGFIFYMKKFHFEQMSQIIHNMFLENAVGKDVIFYIIKVLGQFIKCLNFQLSRPPLRVNKDRL